MTVEEYVIAGMGKGFENGEGVKIAIGNKIEVFSNQGVEKEVSCLLKNVFYNLELFGWCLRVDESNTLKNLYP